MSFRNQYQIAYVTPDIGAAAAILQEQHGVSEFLGLAGDKVVENRVWTPQGEADIGMRAAIATVGHLTLELLQPVSGATDIFTQMLIPGQPLRLHHLGFRCDDFEATAAENERLGRPVVMTGGFKAARFMYVDARATLGHFLEYVAAPPEYWAARG